MCGLAQLHKDKQLGNKRHFRTFAASCPDLAAESGRNSKGRPAFTVLFMRGLKRFVLVVKRVTGI